MITTTVDLNFLKSKLIVKYPPGNLNFLDLGSMDKKVNKTNFFRFGLTYIVAFSIIFSVLNLSFVMGQAQYLYNSVFKTENYELETQILQKFYHGQQNKSIQYQLPVSDHSGNNSNHNNGSLSYFAQAIPTNLDPSVYVPKLSIRAPIIVGTSTTSRQLLADLEKGVLLYPGSAVPGDGQTIIVGHSSSTNLWSKYARIFAGLNRLESGDFIYINYAGKNYVYLVSTKKIGSVTNLASANISGDLVLGTCWPIGTDKDRILVIATLQK